MVLPVFPSLAGLTWPERRRPIWSTIQQASVSNRRTRLQMVTYPQWGFELTYDLLRSDLVNAEWQTLVGFYNSLGGAAQPFTFSAPNDETVVTQAMGVGDGVQTEFQLVRSLGGFVEPVLAPAAGFTVTVAGVPSLDFTLGDGGLLTFNAPPVGALAWTGSYGWVCRFDEDEIAMDRFMTNFWSLGRISFTSEKM